MLSKEFWGTCLVGLVLLWSGLQPFDRTTWWLEVAPVWIGFFIIWLVRPHWRLTGLVFGFICVHAIILAIGGHYTYARVPLGFEVQRVLGLDRNPYDRLGHFMQGWVPALLAREVLRRQGAIRVRAWLPFIVTCICLAFSASYELLEWASALVLGQSADDFLGTQGDPWDTQWDMFLALLGAILSQLMLARVHDWQIDKIRVLSRD